MRQIFLIALFLVLLVLQTSAQSAADKTSEERPKKIIKRGEIPSGLKEKLKVTDADKLEFKEILKSSKGKLIKIWNSLCEYDGKVVDARDTFCLEQFDFRYASNYSLSGIDTSASISLITGQFQADSFWRRNQFLVDLGKTDLVQINGKTQEIIDLTGFPLTDYLKNKKTKLKSKSYEYRGMKINDKHPAKIAHTYLLCSIYQKQNEVTFKTVSRKTFYAFRFVKQKDNIATIIWKKAYQSQWELADKKS